MDDDITNKELQEELQVEQEFQKLLKTYLDSKHRKKVDIIQKAFNFAKMAHKGVRRLSGEPYIMHPLAVAQIVCGEIGLGSTSICAALLHDVVEDTDYTVEDIENMFGQKIAQIVDGLTKIAGGIFGENASVQAENFKKLLITMSEDIRVIIIKIADRLHNMRTLGSQPQYKQYKIAGETLYIYAPLAYRLGLNRIKSELENLSFKYEHPEEYADIVEKLKSTEEQRNSDFNEFSKPITAELTRMGIPHEIKARIKTPYSIWMKMKNKHVSFDDVFDILAVRVIFEPKREENVLQQCFNIYVAMSNFYTPHPDRVRDWVSHPKANGYRALHVTLMSKRGEWVEVQIRSRKMDDIAEKGIAAHWKYKEAQESDNGDKGEDELEEWLNTIKELLDDPQPDAMDFLDTIKLNLFASEIFVVTPKGEFKTMPAGSTALDFAFAIHTNIGTHCIAAKVNHKLVSISHKLQSGDQVEIIAGNTLKVKRNWLNYVTTAKATNKIRSLLNKENRRMRKEGEQLLREFIEKQELTFNTAFVDTLCQLHSLDSSQDLYQQIGEGSIVLGQKDIDAIDEHAKKKRGGSMLRRLLSLRGGKKEDETDQNVEKTSNTKLDKKTGAVIDDNTIYKQYTLAECCRPIPGDQVMGYINEKKQVTIHRVGCKVAERLKANHGNRIVSARWKVKSDLVFLAKLVIQGVDRIGLFYEITEIISNLNNVNMRKITVECNDEMFNGNIIVEVKNTDQVDHLINSISKLNGISSIVRL